MTMNPEQLERQLAQKSGLIRDLTNALGWRNKRVAELTTVLAGIISDTEATYEACKIGKPLIISIGQFRRLNTARKAVAAKPEPKP